MDKPEISNTEIPRLPEESVEAAQDSLLDRLSARADQIKMVGLATTVLWAGAETITRSADAKTTTQNLGLVAHEAASKVKRVSLPKIVPGQTIDQATEGLRKKGFKPGGVVPKDGWPNAKPGNTFEADSYATRTLKKKRINGKTVTKKVFKPVTGKLKSKSRVYIIPDQIERKVSAMPVFPQPGINKPSTVNQVEVVSATPAPESESAIPTPELSFDLMAETYNRTRESARVVPLFNNCSGDGLTNDVGTQIGAVTAKHCNPYLYTEGSDGTYLVTTNRDVKKGQTFDSLTTVARANFLLEPIAPDQNDQSLVGFEGSTPEELLAAHAAKQISPVEARELPKGTPLYATGYPVSPAPRQRQDLKAEVLGTAAVSIRSGTLYQVLVTGVKKNANGAGPSPGFSGAVFNLASDEVDSDGKHSVKLRTAGTALAYESFAGASGAQRRQELEAQFGVSFADFDFACFIATRTGPLKKIQLVDSQDQVPTTPPPAA